MTGGGERVTDLRATTGPAHRRHPRTAMRFVRPGAIAVAEATECCDIAPLRRQERPVVPAENRVDAALMPPRSCLA